MPAQTGPIKVLIADDNEKARRELIELLRFEDVQVVGESTLGTAAFTWADHLSVDIVLVAVAEPLARSLRTNVTTAGTILRTSTRAISTTCHTTGSFHSRRFASRICGSSRWYLSPLVAI